jgi:hypothetical protein
MTTESLDIAADAPPSLIVFESRHGSAVLWFGKVDNFNPPPIPVPPGGSVELVGTVIRVATNDPA